MKKLKCAYCGQEFETESRRQKYCNRQCQIKASNEKKKPKKKKCPNCGREFQPDRHHREYCSVLCLKKADLERRKARYEAVEEKKRSWTYSPQKCEICGKTYTPHSGNSRFCSPECAAEKVRRGKVKPKEERGAAPPERNDIPEASKRFKQMSFRDISAECARLHITYGQASVMAQNGTLPESFGKGK